MATHEPTRSDARFTGSIPELYDRHLGPLLFAGYAVDLATRVKPLPTAGGAVLEVAAGTGIATQQLRGALPATTRLVATDLNGGMLALAESKLRSVGTAGDVEFRIADAMALPFDDGTFDAIVCQFGVMFFPDRALAARESARVLRPGGQWLFSTWGTLVENPFAQLIHETTSAFFATDPPQFYRVPFNLADPDELRGIVEGAGFECRDIVTLDRVVESPSAADAATGFVRGNPLAAAIEERGGVRVQDVERAVALRLAEEFGDHPLRLHTRIRVVDARLAG
jgi:SAM-dependent methyltransferase